MLRDQLFIESTLQNLIDFFMLQNLIDFFMLQNLIDFFKTVKEINYS